MPIFSYIFTHSAGFGNGEIEADNENHAIKKVTSNLEPSEKVGEKLEDVVVQVAEIEQPDTER